MNDAGIHVVTGAFGFAGKYIAERLVDRGYRVRTITSSSNRPNPFGSRIEVYPLTFNRPEELTKSLKGADVLYNTYWVRFNYDSFNFQQAIRNSRILFDSARNAGLRRVVHTSITNPSLSSPFAYFRGKARVELALQQSGLSHAILRPALFFGKEGILINNIAWMLRRFPVFGVFGDGKYRVRPIYVEDFAELAVAQAGGRENITVDALGPETFTFREMVAEIGRCIGKPRPIIPLSPALGYLAAWIMGKAVRDVVLTREEIGGLMAELLYTGADPKGKTKLTSWARENAGFLGKRYQSELALRLSS